MTKKTLTISLILVTLSACTQQSLSCQDLHKNFDLYAEKSQLPFIENSESLCHNLNMSSDFTKLEPKWAIAKLVNIEGNTNLELTFKGQEKELKFNFPTNKLNETELKLDNYYKIDMNNYCRQIFAMLDSRAPSPLLETLIAPEKSKCAL